MITMEQKQALVIDKHLLSDYNIAAVGMMMDGRKLPKDLLTWNLRWEATKEDLDADCAHLDEDIEMAADEVVKIAAGKLSYDLSEKMAFLYMQEEAKAALKYRTAFHQEAWEKRQQEDHEYFADGNWAAQSRQATAKTETETGEQLLAQAKDSGFSVEQAGIVIEAMKNIPWQKFHRYV